MGEIYLDLNFPTLALSYFIDANEKSMIKGKKPWILINIGKCLLSTGAMDRGKRKISRCHRCF